MVNESHLSSKHLQRVSHVRKFKLKQTPNLTEVKGNNNQSVMGFPTSMILNMK